MDHLAANIGDQMTRSRVPAAERPEVAQHTFERFATRSLGGWLFNLVRHSASEHYRDAGGAFVEDLAEVDLRIDGIAKMLARDPDHAELIAERARKMLRERTTGPYFYKVAWRSFLDILRVRRRSVPLKGDVASRQAAVGAGLLDPNTAPKLRELLMTRRGLRRAKPYELSVFAWHRYAGRRPAGIVAEFATLTSGALARSMIRILTNEMAEEEGAQSLIAALQESTTQEFADRRLQDIWDPVRKVDLWIRTEPQPGREMKLHERLSQVFATSLGYDAGSIVAELGELTLGELAARAWASLPLRNGRPQSFAVPATAANVRLSAFFGPRNVVGDWSFKVARSLCREAWHQAREGTGLILFHHEFAPHELLAFLVSISPGARLPDMAREFRNQPLAALEAAVERRFAWHWFCPLEEATKWFRSLRLRCSSEKRNLSAVTGASDLTDSLARSRDKVWNAVMRDFENPDVTPLFAFRHGLRKDGLRKGGYGE